MKVFTMMLLVVMMVACGGEEPETDEMTSGEIYCDALFMCEEVDVNITHKECVLEYDSNLCDVDSKESCFRKFNNDEKRCLSEIDPCVAISTGGDCLSEEF